ncbi:MAG: AbrB family transcriptional regulator [Hyphomicrobiaceae bacterium]
MSKPTVSLLQSSRTLAIGVAGGTAFWLLGLPLPWLSGPAASVAGMSLAGWRLGLYAPLRETAIIVLGLMFGSTVTPDTIALMPRWPATLLGLVGAILSIMAAGAWYLERVHKLDRATARLASMPGTLSFVMVLALETNSDPRRVAIIQVIRLTAILLLLPSIVTLFGDPVPSGMYRPAGQTIVKYEQLALLLAAGFLSAHLFARLKTPAPQLFGAMLAAALLYGPGILDSAIPPWTMVPVFVVLGAMIGSNYLTPI